VPQKLPVCSNPDRLVGMDFGSRGGLYFRPMKEIKATRPKTDTDHLYRHYYIASQGKKGLAIHHNTGVDWMGGPSDEDVWRSSYFEEVDYPGELDSIVDARGQMPDGSRWRSLGGFGKSASYYGVTKETADLFDRFLDSACFVHVKTPSLQQAKKPGEVPGRAAAVVPASEPK